MYKSKRHYPYIFLLFFFTLGNLKPVQLYAQIAAFPGAEGFGSLTTGGRGGRVVYVTNLNADGPGSLQAAINETGIRYILFKVSGVIPTTIEIPSGHGEFTLAGQTSPNGIIVRGIVSYNDELPSSSNFMIRHLRSRIGDLSYFPTNNWLAGDGITLGGVRDVIIDHCSFAHANDEAVDISRSSSISIQNCILAETLGGHSDLGGMLINYSSVKSPLDSLSIHHNVWNRIGGRMPEISCESPHCNGRTIKIELSNNLAWDPRIELWYEGPTGQNGQFYLQMNAVNNVFYAAPTYSNGMYHFDILNFSQNRLYFSGNKMNLYPQYSDYQLFYCCNDFPTNLPNTDFGLAQRSNTRFSFPQISYHSSMELLDYSSTFVGAFPRDAMDQRLMTSIKNRSIDPRANNVDHDRDAFSISNTKQSPLDSDLDGMPDYWEQHHGLNPNLQDHNGNILSMPIYGVNGYTNLECYLNCLSDALVNGVSSQACGIRLDGTSFSVSNPTHKRDIKLYPNPVLDNYIQLEGMFEHECYDFQIEDLFGRCFFVGKLNSTGSISVSHLPMGYYILKATSIDGSITWERKFIK